MKQILYIVVQCTWGILQTLVGFCIFLVCIKRTHYIYNGSVATVWGRRTSASLGLFIFITADAGEDFIEKTKVHEYGHTIQSLILGPLYLPAAALPSMIWCMLPALVRYRAKRSISYYAFYSERWANYLGEKFTGQECFKI